MSDLVSACFSWTSNLLHSLEELLELLPEAAPALDPPMRPTPRRPVLEDPVDAVCRASRASETGVGRGAAETKAARTTTRSARMDRMVATEAALGIVTSFKD